MFDYMTVSQIATFILGIVFSIFSITTTFLSYKYSKNFNSFAKIVTIGLIAPFIAMISWLFLIFSFLIPFKNDEVLTLFVSILIALVICGFIILIAKINYNKNKEKFIEEQNTEDSMENVTKEPLLITDSTNIENIENENNNEINEEEVSEKIEETNVEENENNENNEVSEDFVEENLQENNELVEENENDEIIDETEESSQFEEVEDTNNNEESENETNDIASEENISEENISEENIDEIKQEENTDNNFNTENEENDENSDEDKEFQEFLDSLRKKIDSDDNNQ